MIKRKKDKYSFNDYFYRIPGYIVTGVCLFFEIYLRIYGIQTPQFDLWDLHFPGLLTIASIGMISLGLPLLEPVINYGVKIYKNIRGN